MADIFDVEMALKIAGMLEGYYDVIKKECAVGKLYSLNAEDGKLWNDKFYPALLKCPKINDAGFFEPEENHDPNYGVGSDGKFFRYEYCNLLYQLYRFIFWEKLGNRNLMEIIEGNPNVAPAAKAYQLLECLEAHVEPLEKKGTKDQVLYHLEGEELEAWNEFYQWNSLTHMVPDGEFFGDDRACPDLGIGKDGAYYGVELLHFLFQVYRILCKLILGGEEK